MTYEALIEAIKRLMKKREEAHGNYEEQDRINAKLSKLYDLRVLMLQQKYKG